MTRRNVERLRRGYETWNRTGAVESILRKLDPAVTISVPIEALDYAGATFEGHEGVRQAIEILMDPWSETRFEPIEFIDGGDKVLVICRQRSRGRHTDLEVEQVLAHLWFAGESGKATRLEIFFDPERAREKLSASQR